jgi:hypothetical protein
MTESRSVVVWMGSEVGVLGAGRAKKGGKEGEKRAQRNIWGVQCVRYLECGEGATGSHIKFTKHTLQICVVYFMSMKPVF